MDPQTERDLRYLAETERTLKAMRDRICEPKNDTNPAYTGSPERWAASERRLTRSERKKRHGGADLASGQGLGTRSCRDVRGLCAAGMKWPASAAGALAVAVCGADGGVETRPGVEGAAAAACRPDARSTACKPARTVGLVSRRH